VTDRKKWKDIVQQPKPTAGVVPVEEEEEYILIIVGFYFHINFIQGRKGPVGTDEILRLSLGHLGRHTFQQKQAELQTHRQ
jgi:hypothetical protein